MKPVAAMSPRLAVDSPTASCRSEMRAKMTLVEPALLAEAVTVQFPGLAGVHPGLGRQNPMDWGLGFDLRSTKEPSWMGETANPASFGHFGGSGTFLWVDPELDRGAVALADREFDEWALAAWIPFNDALLAELRAKR